MQKINKSGCYRYRIFEDRYDPVESLVLWDDNRLRMGDTFYSFWEHGRLTPGEAMRREEENLHRSAREAADVIEQMKKKQDSQNK
jgi:hypothetical protein